MKRMICVRNEDLNVIILENKAFCQRNNNKKRKVVSFSGGGVVS